MRKVILHLTNLLLFLVTITSFGQSLLILPERTLSESSWGDNIRLSSNSTTVGIQSLRFNGSLTSKSAVLANDELFRIGGGGYIGSSNLFYEKAAIFFRASQNWNGTAAGTKISFLTTLNNTVGLTERMVIDNAGNVGLGNTAPTARLHINHFASGASPHLHLQSTGSNSSVIRASSTGLGIWENHFLTNNVAAANLVYWYNPTAGTTPLIITGEGDAIVERNASVGGYTNLGASAPKIKMKELSVNTSATAGGVAYVAHGLTMAKILSVSILVNSSVGHDYPPGYGSTTAPGFQYFYFLTTTHVVIENSGASYANIAGRPARILITYEE